MQKILILIFCLLNNLHTAVDQGKLHNIRPLLSRSGKVFAGITVVAIALDIWVFLHHKPHGWKCIWSLQPKYLFYGTIWNTQYGWFEFIQRKNRSLKCQYCKKESKCKLNKRLKNMSLAHHIAIIMITGGLTIIGATGLLGSIIYQALQKTQS
jgi:hypothetical protein